MVDISSLGLFKGELLRKVYMTTSSQTNIDPTKRKVLESFKSVVTQLAEAEKKKQLSDSLR